MAILTKKGEEARKAAKKASFNECKGNIDAIIFQFFAMKCNWDSSDAELMAKKLLKPVYKEVKETAGNPYSSEDIYIAIRRCIMRQYKLIDV